VQSKSYVRPVNTPGIINRGTTGRNDKKARYGAVMLAKAGCFLRRAFLTTDRLDQVPSHTRSPTISSFHDFVSMMTRSLGDNDLWIPNAAYCRQGLASA
jgi:hypothetical protein